MTNIMRQNSIHPCWQMRIKNKLHQEPFQTFQSIGIVCFQEYQFWIIFITAPVLQTHNVKLMALEVLYTWVTTKFFFLLLHSVQTQKWKKSSFNPWTPSLSSLRKKKKKNQKINHMWIDKESASRINNGTGIDRFLFLINIHFFTWWRATANFH